MTIETVAAQLVAIVKEYNEEMTLNFKTFIDPPPDMLDGVHLPACYVLTSGANDQTDNDDFYLETRVYRLQCPIVTKGDATARVRESRIRPLIRKIKELFSGYQSLNLPSVRSVRVLGDSGIVMIPEYGAKFVGFEVRIEVTEIVTRKWRD